MLACILSNLHSWWMRSSSQNLRRQNKFPWLWLFVFPLLMKVSAYGFMTPDYKSYSDHYYDSTHRRVGFYVNHDLRMEMTLWQQLHKAGLIRLYMRQWIQVNQEVMSSCLHTSNDRGKSDGPACLMSKWRLMTLKAEQVKASRGFLYMRGTRILF